jgi:hypothetical protein
VVLGVVFGVAGAAKLADRVGSRTALVDFGIPTRFAAPGAVLLPLGELGVAAALLADPSARAGAAGALALLMVFSFVVALNLAAGRQLDCHCLGRLHSSPIGAATLVRNGLLGVLSALVMVGGPGTEAGDALDPGLTVGLALAAAAVGVGWRFLAVRRVGGAHQRQVRHAAAETSDGTTLLPRRRALALLAMTVAGAALGLNPAKATACGAQCRSSSDCPGTCTNCRKRPGEMTGHCH